MTRFARLLITPLVILAAFAGLAEETTAEQANHAARQWLRKHPMPMESNLTGRYGRTRTIRRADGSARYHIVDFDGGGFVVASGDTRQSPIVCFSESGTLELEDGNPLKAIIEEDMDAQRAATAAPPGGPRQESSDSSRSNEREWRELLDEDIPAYETPNEYYSSAKYLSDLCVPALVKSQWNQSRWSGKNVFNLYTPYNYVCGCVATAFSQVMRYWKYPSKAVTPASYGCWVNDWSSTRKMYGGKYAWNYMPLKNPGKAKLTSTHRKAIGKLTYDVGVASRMNWGSDGSGAFGAVTVPALTSRFGYASARCYRDSTQYSSTLAGSGKNAILASLDAGMPVVIGIGGSEGGHEVVIDGYGKSYGTVYMHMNCGWSDTSDNVWYRLFSEKVTSLNFSYMKEICYNIHPTKKGIVLSGRVTDYNTGKPVKGAVVVIENPAGKKAAVKTNARGIYFFRINATGTYELTAAYGKKVSTTRSTTIGTLGSDATITPYNTYGTWTSSGSVGNSWGNDLALRTPIAVGLYPNGGVGKAVAWKVVPGVSTKIPTPAFAREGYAIKGWATSPKGSVYYTAGSYATFYSTTKLYAVYGPGPLRTVPKIVASDGATDAGVVVKWTATPGATGYYLTRDSKVIARLSGRSYVDEGAAGSVQYAYRVFATNAVSSVSSANETGWSKPRFRLDFPRFVFDRGSGIGIIPLRWNVDVSYSNQASSWLSCTYISGLGVVCGPGDNSAGRYRTGYVRFVANYPDRPGAASKEHELYFRVDQMGSDFTVPDTYEAGSFKGLAATYDGYAYDGNDYNPVATVTVVVGARAGGKSKVTATVVLNGVKYVYAGVTSNGIISGLTCKTKGAPALSLEIGADGLKGRLGSYYVYGTRRGYGAAAFAGKRTLRLDAPRSDGAYSSDLLARATVSVAANGKATVLVVTAAGKTASAAGWLTTDPASGYAYLTVRMAIPGIGTKNLLFRLQDDGTFELIGGLPSDSAQSGYCEAPEYVDWDEMSDAMVGVRYYGQLEIDDLAYPAKFAASGLPPGLTVDPATGRVSGVPKKAGTYPVTFAVKGQANATWPLRKITATIVVGVMPWQAIGTFLGEIESGDSRGSAKISTTAAGVISGKVTIKGRTWSFAAPAWEEFSWDTESVAGGEGFFRIENLAAKCVYNGKTYTGVVELCLDACGRDVSINGRLIVGDNDYGIFADRYLWDRADCKRDFLTGMAGRYEVFTDDADPLTAVVGATGAVAVSGRLSNGRAVKIKTVLMCEVNGGPDNESYSYYILLDAPAETVNGRKYPAFHSRCDL